MKQIHFKKIAFRSTQALLILLVLSAASPAQIVLADDLLNSSDYYTQIDNNMFEPTDDNSTGQCTNTTGGSTGGAIPDFNPDPKAVSQFEASVKPALAKLTPLYQQAAKAEGLADWTILPGIHYREHGMSMSNPSENGDGVFQTQTHYANDPNDPNLYAPGKALTDTEFVEQLRAAIKFYIIPYAKDKSVDPTKQLSADDAAKIAYAYNSGPGWTPDFHTSAYAWSGFNRTTYAIPMTGIIGHNIQSDQRPGAATIFAIVRSGNTGTTTPDSCSGNPASGSLGNVVWYSQYDKRWAGDYNGLTCGTIADCGCYLTDLAMIASTLPHTRPDPNDPKKMIGPAKPTPANEPYLDVNSFGKYFGYTVSTLHGFDGSHPSKEDMEQKVTKALDGHALVLIHGNYGAFWTVVNNPGAHEHWIIIRGYTGSGDNIKFSVNDPADVPNSPNGSGTPAQTSWGEKSHTYQQWPVSEFTQHAWDMYAIKSGA